MPPEKDDKIAEAQLTLQMQGNEKLNTIAEAIQNVDKTLEAGLVQKMDEEKGAEVRMVDEDGKTFIIKGRRGPPGIPGRPGKDPDENKIIKEVTTKVSRIVPKKEEIKEEVLSDVLKKIPTKLEIVNAVRPLIKDGEDGDDADPQEVANFLKGDESFLEKTKGEPGKPGKDGSPDSPKELAEKINTLNKVIEWKVIKNIPDFKKGGGPGYLRELSDVSIVGISDGQSIIFDAATNKWIPYTPGSSGGGHVIMDDGAVFPQRANLNFVGDGVTITDNAGGDQTVVTIPSLTPAHENSPVPLRTFLNFIGSGVSVTDNAGTDSSDVTITDSVFLDGSNTSASATGQVMYFNGSEWIALANPIGAGSYNLQNNAGGNLVWGLMVAPITPSWSSVLTAGRVTNGAGTQNPQLTGSDRMEFRGTGTYIYSSGSNTLDIVSGGTLNINTTNFGIFGVAAVARQTLGATLTNNVTSGGTANTVANFSVLQSQAASGSDTVDITDVPSKASIEAVLQIIRNNQYQQSAVLKIVVDALRAYGLLT